MIAEADRLEALLATAPLRRYEKRLSRWVAQASVDEVVRTEMQRLLNLAAATGVAPELSPEQVRVNYLFTSARAGRYNPAGVPVLYFAEDRFAEEAERARYYTGLDLFQPAQRFYGVLKVDHLLDLGDASVLHHLGLTNDDLFAPWRFALSAPRTQELGRAVARQQRVAALRFPSDACRKTGTTGYNVAIFKSALVRPDSFTILGRAGVVLQSWPTPG